MGFNESPSNLLKINSINEHKIVHLISRPTQLYYYYGVDDNSVESLNTNKLGINYENENKHIEMGIGHVCRIKVPSNEVFYIAYEEDIPNPSAFIQLSFHCSQYWAWCCGLDPTILFFIFCLSIVIIACAVHFALRSTFLRRFCIERLLRAGGVIKGKKKIIARANAQRRKRSGSSSGKRRSSNNSSLLFKGKEGNKKLNRVNSLLVKSTENGIREKLMKKGSVKTFMGNVNRCSSVVPQIIVTEPSSCYEPSYKSIDEEDEEDDELMFDDEVEDEEEIY
ncbi:hypothetical protein Mgra_00003909 [Meloidogyne graminicola]|uniref:Uncharacterized protein n=1 Tax=Meloidogyne graminicola TaxID=189291 RepID=A0A8S9ZU57_9BILA|nr:hypothetical protein Mgra_00003909 [Meloidogyne graminicola]